MNLFYTARLWAVLLLTASVTFAGCLALRESRAVAYDYVSPGYYLAEHDYVSYVYTSVDLSYGDWACAGGFCDIPIFGMHQHANVASTTSEFTCWYDQVGTIYGNNRAGARLTNYYTTPWTNYQYTWGFAHSFGGDQVQFTALGRNDSQCWAYGAGSGAYLETTIPRYSSAAYLSLYAW